MWGKVKLARYEIPCSVTGTVPEVSKNVHFVLFGVGSIQAYRINLRVYVKIGISERGKVGTSQYGEYTLDGVGKVERG